MSPLATFARVILLACALPLPLLAQSKTVPNGKRTFAADSFWVREWVRGNSKEPDLLTEPRHVVAAHGIVVVLDDGTREITAFDARTGQSRFNLQAKGEGPGEFRRPLLIAATQSGFAVVDQATSRVTAFDSLGRLQWNAPLLDAVSSNGICVLRRGLLISKTSGAIGSILLSDTTGRLLSRRTLDERGRKADDLAWSTHVTGPDASDNCVFARQYGANWYVVSPSGPLAMHTYIEAGSEPAVNTKQAKKGKVSGKQIVEVTHTTDADPIASNAMLLGDTLIVRATGSGRNQYRLLDYYVISSGAYLYSRRLPLAPNAVTVGPNGTFYALGIGEESAGIWALKPSLKRPPPPPPAPRKP